MFEKGPFAIVPDVPPLCYSIGDLYGDSRLCAWPCKAFRALVTAISGSWLIMTIPPAMLLAHMDVKDWLLRCDSSDLSSCSTWKLEEGDSLFVAYGYLPLYIHYTKEQLAKQQRGPQAKEGKKKKAKHPWNSLGAISVNLLLDKGQDPQNDPEIVAHIISQYAAAAAWVPPEVKAAIESSGWCKAMSAQQPTVGVGASLPGAEPPQAEAK